VWCARVLRRPFCIEFGDEVGQESGEFSRAKQEGIPFRTPAERLLRDGKGFVENQTTGCDERCDPREERSVEVVEDEDRAEMTAFEDRKGWLFEILAKRLDGSRSIVWHLPAIRREFHKGVRVHIDRGDCESHCGDGQGMASSAAGEVEYRTKGSRL
jgi:hypothetical protein